MEKEEKNKVSWYVELFQSFIIFWLRNQSVVYGKWKLKSFDLLLWQISHRYKSLALLQEYLSSLPSGQAIWSDGQEMLNLKRLDPQIQ